MESVRKASLEWISLAIQRQTPQEQQPAELAESLLTIAEQFDVPVEAVREWIDRQEHNQQISAREFSYWAKACDATREMERQRDAEDWRDDG